jgi:hypothetical protein
VELAPLAGEQLRCRRLAHEGMAEADPSVVADGQDAALDRLVDRRANVDHRAVRHGHEELLVDRAAAQRGDPRDFPGLRRQERQARGHRCGQGRRRVPVAHRRQLLDKKGIAVRAAPGPLDRANIGHGAEDGGHLRPHSLAIERGEIEALHARLPSELGEPSVRIGPDILRATGQHDQHRFRRQVAGEEGHEVTGGPVDPVDVLEGEQDGPIGRKAPQDGQHALLHPRGVERLVGPRAVLAEGGNQPSKLRAQRPEHRLELRPGHRPRQPAERLRQREEREAAVREVQAAADEHPAACVLHGRRQLVDQARLSDPRLPADEHHARRAVGRRIERGDEPRQVAIATHEGMALSQDGTGVPREPVAHARQGTPPERARTARR